MQKIIQIVQALSLSSLLAISGCVTAEEEAAADPTPVKVAVVVKEALVVDVDQESREVSLELPHGTIVTLAAGPAITRLDEIKVGDYLVASYLEAIAGEVREPTEEELAEPFVLLEEFEIAGTELPPGASEMQGVRAVCTVEGMNRYTRTVMVKDSRGKYHVIGDVDPARLEGVTLGTTVIITYMRAMALSLEKAPAPE